jgi:hypothetical protein
MQVSVFVLATRKRFLCKMHIRDTLSRCRHEAVAVVVGCCLSARTGANKATVKESGHQKTFSYGKVAEYEGVAKEWIDAGKPERQ